MNTIIAGDGALRYDIRPARAEDFDCLVRLRIETMRKSLERIGRYDERRAFDRFRSTFRPEYTHLIEMAGELAGCIALKPSDECLFLEHFYIASAHQNRGLGSAILKHFLSLADEAQLPVRLSVLRQSDAIRFYLHHNFIESGQGEFDVYLSRPCFMAGRGAAA